MTPKTGRRPGVWHVALLGLLAATGCQSWRPTAAPDATATVTAPPTNVAGRSAGSAQTAVPPEVKIEAAMPVHPAPVETGRNPFRFGSRRPIRPEPATGDRGPEPFESPSAPRPVTRSTTVPLKFIGIVEAPDSVGTVAVLSDGRSVYYGRQNDIIEGRYRIVRIGVESIDLELLDGGDRQTIRLSGS